MSENSKRRQKPGYDSAGQMTGQLSLFTLDGAEDWVREHYADEGESVHDQCPLCPAGQQDGDHADPA